MTGDRKIRKLDRNKTDVLSRRSPPETKENHKTRVRTYGVRVKIQTGYLECFRHTVQLKHSSNLPYRNVCVLHFPQAPAQVYYQDILDIAIVLLTFRHRASCILGQAFHYFPENASYLFNQQIYFIICYLLDRASLI